MSNKEIHIKMDIHMRFIKYNDKFIDNEDLRKT